MKKTFPTCQLFVGGVFLAVIKRLNSCNVVCLVATRRCFFAWVLNCCQRSRHDSLASHREKIRNSAGAATKVSALSSCSEPCLEATMFLAALCFCGGAPQARLSRLPESPSKSGSSFPKFQCPGKYRIIILVVESRENYLMWSWKIREW